MIYGIIGGGKHPENVIEDGLKDLYSAEQDNTLYLCTRTGATDSEKRVYAWVLDNHIPFNAVVKGSSAPRSLLESADYISTVEHAEAYIIREVAARLGTLLVLWDDERSDELSALLCDASELGVKILELSNGLVPILVDEPTATETVNVDTPKVEEVEIEPLTTDDLNDMNIAMLKKAAFAQGISDAGGMSKEQLVNAISGGPEVASDAHAINTNAGVHVAMIVWYQDGIMQAMPMPLERLKPLLG